MPMPTTRAKGARYTPVSKRQDKPDGIAWLLRTFPELSDAQIGKLLGTTKPTITAIRDRTHWNAPNIRPRDPVDLGLCARGELDEAVQKARRRATRRAKDAAREARKAGIEPEVQPADQILGSAHAAPEPAYAPAPEPEPVAPTGPAPTAANLFKTPERDPDAAPAEDGPDNPVLDPNLLFKPKPAAPEDKPDESDDKLAASEGETADADQPAEGHEKGNG